MRRAGDKAVAPCNLEKMTAYIENEAVALAKCLAWSLTCSGNRARKARQTADDLLKWQLHRVCTDNFSGMTEAQRKAVDNGG